MPPYSPQEIFLITNGLVANIAIHLKAALKIQQHIGIIYCGKSFVQEEYFTAMKLFKHLKEKDSLTSLV